MSGLNTKKIRILQKLAGVQRLKRLARAAQKLELKGGSEKAWTNLERDALGQAKKLQRRMSKYRGGEEGYLKRNGIAGHKTWEEAFNREGPNLLNKLTRRS